MANRAVRGDFGVFDFLIRCCTEERLEFDRAVIWMDGWYTGELYRLSRPFEIYVGNPR